VKEATVRLGLFREEDGAFLDTGSGVLVSEEGLILTAAHVVIGPPRYHKNLTPGQPEVEPDWKPQWEWPAQLHLKEGMLPFAVGLYRGDGKPAEWVAWATVVTDDATLRELHREGTQSSGLLDLAVLQISGELTLDPSTYTPPHDPNHAPPPTRLLHKDSSREAALKRMPEPLVIDRSGTPIALGAPLCVCGWATPLSSMRQLNLDYAACLFYEHDMIHSKAWVHSGSSGGPCVNADAEVVGIVSLDNNTHHSKHRFMSTMRSVRALRPSHGLPERQAWQAVEVLSPLVRKVRSLSSEWSFNSNSPTAVNGESQAEVGDAGQGESAPRLQ